jgi:putative spermidine/putrescine transport system substrate-binding protein
MAKKLTLRLAAVTVASALVVGAAIAASNSASAASVDFCKATDLKSAGGLDALVAAAKKEGALNLITTPRDWAGYGDMFDIYEKAFGVKITVDNPDGSSQYEIDTMKTAPKSKQPDSIDIGPLVVSQLVAPGAKPLSAPYKVATWNDIPANAKDANGYWFGNYSGKLAIVYNADVAVAPTKASDFTNPAYKGVVGISGDPTSSNQAFMSVVAASLGNGGAKKLSDVTPGLALYKAAKAANGALVKVNGSNLLSGAAKVGFNWDFNSIGFNENAAKAGITLKWTYPSDYVLQAPPYINAINAKAPHCANARLWQEYVYSENEGKTAAQITAADLKLSGSKLFAKIRGGQNIFQRNAALPVTNAAMSKKKLLPASQVNIPMPATAKVVNTMTVSDILAAREQIIGAWASL